MKLSQKPLTSWLIILSAAVIAIFPTGCSSPETDSLHGYVEGEFIYSASPLQGTVTLAVSKGERVKKGALLFTLESEAEKETRDEARLRVKQAEAALLDAEKGLRPSELSSLRAQLKQAKTSLEISEKEYARKKRLLPSGAVSINEVDAAESSRDQQLQLVARLEADLQTARLGARQDQLEALRANVKALGAALARREWELAQKSRRSPEDAVVYETLYRNGEWVAACRPVVSLLPPGGIKARVFVPENLLATIHLNDTVTVSADGIADKFKGKVTYISPRPEYTPPIIYSRESRTRQVYMIEAGLGSEAFGRLHPGQPVDISFRR